MTGFWSPARPAPSDGSKRNGFKRGLRRPAGVAAVALILTAGPVWAQNPRTPSQAQPLILDVPAAAGMPAVEAAPVEGVEAVPLDAQGDSALASRVDEALSAAEALAGRAAAAAATEGPEDRTEAIVLPSAPILPESPAAAETAPAAGTTIGAAPAIPSREPPAIAGPAPPVRPGAPTAPDRAPLPPTPPTAAVDRPTADPGGSSVLGDARDILAARDSETGQPIDPLTGRPTVAADGGDDPAPDVLGAADVLLPLGGSLCRRLVGADPTAARFRPGVTADGGTVARAEVDGGRTAEAFAPPPVVNLILTAPLADRLDLPLGVAGEGRLAAVGIDTLTGGLSVNGQPLVGAAIEAVREACRAGLDRAEQP